MPLSQLDLELLHLIELRPTISVQELAKKTGVSWITANRHIQRLRDERILSDPVAVFNPGSFGLVRHVVFVECRNEDSLRTIELACDLHPYTHYRSRVYGPYPGAFAQFDIPVGGERHLVTFFNRLSNISACDVRVLRKSSGYRKSTVPNLALFDPKSMTWEYDWSAWTDAIAQASTKLPSDVPPSERRTSTPPNLTRTDLEILRELTANANINQSSLQKRLSLSQSTVSRKVIFLRESFIDSVRAQIDRSRFDITSTKMFYCDEVDIETQARLFNALHSESAPPFPMSIDLLDGNALLLWGRMPPSHEHSLFYVLWRYLPGLQVFTMDTVRDHSRLYWFYPENFDVDTQSWRNDERWMVDEPLRQLESRLRE